jgi:hypothetical protein
MMARVVSAARSSRESSMMIDYIKYSVTTAQLDPMATLAAATL